MSTTAIPVIADYNGRGSHAVITPEHIAQFLGDLPERLETVRTSTNEMIVALGQRLAVLEASSRRGFTVKNMSGEVVVVSQDGREVVVQPQQDAKPCEHRTLLISETAQCATCGKVMDAKPDPMRCGLARAEGHAKLDAPKIPARIRDDGKRVHSIKCWPEFYREVSANRKRYEIRKDDRDYQVGDLLDLGEWDPSTQEPTGRCLMREVTYLMRDFPGLASGYCLMSIAPIAPDAAKPDADEAADGKPVTYAEAWGIALAERDDARAECDALKAHINALCDELGACKHYAEMADGLSGDLPIAERVEQALVMIKDLDGYSEGMASVMDENEALAEALRLTLKTTLATGEVPDLLERVRAALAAHDARRAGT